MAEKTVGKAKRIFQLALLILAGGVIYPLVYLRQNFESTILTVFDMNQAELAQIYSVLGIMFVVGYIPSGWLADKFQVKWLLVGSLLVTAAAGLVYAQLPDKKYLIYIFLVWGFSTIFTFWSALLKATSLLAGPNQGGRFFGALDGGRGLVEAILASVAVALFAWVTRGNVDDLAQTTAGFKAVVYMYIAAVVLVAVLLVIVFPKAPNATVETTNEAPTESTLAAVLRIVKIPEVWWMIVILFCGYVLFWGHYYFSGFLNVNHGVTAVTAGVITVTVLWMRPIGGFGGGFLADRFGRSRVLSVAMYATSAALLLLTLIPSGSLMWLIYAAVVFAGLLMYVIRGVYWSLLDDCRVPPSAVGFAIGIISFFGYLPDIVIPKISEIIYDSFGDNVAGANNLFFLVVAGFGLIGAIAATLFAIRMRKRESAESETTAVSV